MSGGGANMSGVGATGGQGGQNGPSSPFATAPQISSTMADNFGGASLQGGQSSNPYQGLTSPTAGADWRSAYLAANPDVAQNWQGTPEQHYSQYGQREGRLTNSPADRYNSMVAADPSALARPSTLSMNPYAVDYSNIFNPTPVFDEQAYLQQKLSRVQAAPGNEQFKNYTPDQLRSFMASQGMTPQQHYESFGRAEGLTPYSTRLQGRQVLTPQATLNPQQQADYISGWQGAYGDRVQRGIGDARMQRIARAQKVQEDYNTKKAQAEAQAAASNQEAINRAVQEALAQQQAASYSGDYTGQYGSYAGKAGGIASLAKGFKK